MNNPFIHSVRFRPWGAVFSRVSFACLRGFAYGIALTGLCLAPAAQAQNVNWIQEVGASTGNTPGIYARGSDANIGLNLIPKGNGAVNVSGSFTVNGAPLAGSGATDRLVSGSALLRLSDDSLDLTDTSHATLNVTGGATSNAVLQLGAGRTGNGYAYIDLVGDPTYTDYGLRLLRDTAGENSQSWLQQRGTGAFNFVTQEAAPFHFFTNSAFAMAIASSGNVGIGTTTPGAKLEVKGGSSDNAALILKNNADAYYSLWNDNGSSGLNFQYGGATKMLLTSSGNLGINTTAPGTPLDVNGHVTIGSRLRGRYTYGSDYFWIGLDGSLGEAGGNAIGIEGAAAGTGLVKALHFLTNGSERVIIDQSGNVGIGTTAPTEKLQVEGGNVAFKGSWATGNGPLLSLINTSGATPGAFGPGVLINSSVSGKHGYVLTQMQNAESYFTISNPSSPYNSYLAIDQSGNVGIGTTAPNAKLHLVGGDNAWWDGILLSQSGTSGRTYSLASREGGRFSIGDESAGTHRFTINSSGNIGIGTVDPTTKLHVAAGGARFNNVIIGQNASDGGMDMAYPYESVGVTVGNLRLQSPGGIGFHTGMTSSEPDGNSKMRMFIDSSGNVGMGTTEPTEKLAVLGNIRVLGTEYMVYNSNRCKSDGDAGTDPLGYCEGNGRALVHDTHDRLVINYAGDFDGGVAVGSNLQVDGNVTAAAYYQSSDLRLKTNVAAIDDPFALLAGVEGRHFRWKASGKAAYGVIAQDVARVMPEAVGRGTSGTLTVDYAQMVAPLVEAVKQLDQRVKALEAENLRLQAARRSH